MDGMGRFRFWLECGLVAGKMWSLWCGTEVGVRLLCRLLCWVTGCRL